MEGQDFFNYILRAVISRLCPVFFFSSPSNAFCEIRHRIQPPWDPCSNRVPMFPWDAGTCRHASTFLSSALRKGTLTITILWWNAADNFGLSFLMSLFSSLPSVFYLCFFVGFVVWLWIQNNGTIICLHLDELGWPVSLTDPIRMLVYPPLRLILTEVCSNKCCPLCWLIWSHPHAKRERD